MNVAPIASPDIVVDHERKDPKQPQPRGCDTFGRRAAPVK
jgi:hypothetical protein